MVLSGVLWRVCFFCFWANGWSFLLVVGKWLVVFVGCCWQMVCLSLLFEKPTQRVFHLGFLASRVGWLALHSIFGCGEPADSTA